MKKRIAKMVAMATAMVLVLGSNSLAAFAAEETDALQKVITKWDTTEENSDWVWSDVGDEVPGTVVTDVDEANDKSSADISILAKVVEHGDIVYKVDISWGAMKFEFNNQAGKWDTDSHTYKANNGVSAEWTVDGYINEENNEIKVVNHSNWAVDTTFSYAHEGTPFNDTQDENAVRGHFFLTNDAAVLASKKLTSSANVDNALTTALTLGHQDADNATKYGGAAGGTALDGTDIPAIAENADGSCTRYVYFTFNGTPDIANMDDALKTDFTKVGVITVTIAPWENRQ